MKDFNFKPFLGLLFAAAAGVSAFVSEMDSQKKEKELEELKERVSNLEENK